MITRRFAIAFTAMALFNATQTTIAFADAPLATETETGRPGIISAEPSRTSQRFSAQPPRDALKPTSWVGLNPQPEPPTVNRRL